MPRPDALLDEHGRQQVKQVGWKNDKDIKPKRGSSFRPYAVK